MGITADLATANGKLDDIKTGIADLKTAISTISGGGDTSALTQGVANLQMSVDGITTGINDIKATL